MDVVAVADAKNVLIAGMTAILFETDSKDFLRKTFDECMEPAEIACCAELSRISREARAGRNVELPKGTAVTREYWMGMIGKLLGPLSEDEVRDFFELMLERTKERKALRTT